MTTETKSNHAITYLAITIGPIYKTIQQARKTRELWAASFFLSQLMREILQRLEDKQWGSALSPNTLELKNSTKYHGAGIWNDNCFYALHSTTDLEEVKKDLPGLLSEAKAGVFKYLKIDYAADNKRIPLTAEQISGLFDRHFYCTAALHTRTPGQEKQERVLIALGKQLASAETMQMGPERYDDYIGAILFQPKTVLDLYKLGFDPQDKVFTALPFNERRLPSLLELATREFKRYPLAYEQLVNVVSDQYKSRAKQLGKEPPTDPELIQIAREETSATPEEDFEILNILKSVEENGKSVFKKRHKYVAIVQSDGDGIGKIVRGFEDDDTTGMAEFSKQLMRFSQLAVDEIADFDGLPVYAGGDDLLFIAPLQDQNGATLFDLLEKIQDHFAAQPLLQARKTSMSFGISIFYYKSPMGEGLQEGRKQLFQVAKKLAFSAQRNRSLNPGESPDREKKAISFRVLLHGGQAFGTVLQQDGKVWEQWRELFEKSAQADTAFLSGMVHRMENLVFLLADACDHNQADFFFDRHFNEANERQKVFIKAVKDLAIAIYKEYGTLHLSDSDQHDFFVSQLSLSDQELKNWPNVEELRQRFCNNLLYSALRMIQFFKAEDHE